MINYEKKHNHINVGLEENMKSMLMDSHDCKGASEGHQMQSFVDVEMSCCVNSLQGIACGMQKLLSH